FAHPVDLVVVDASFIGLGKLIDAVEAVLKPGGDLIALVKPQFEAGRRAAEAGKGVIRDPNTRRAAIANATADVERAGFIIRAGFDCPLPGPKGNVEYLLWAKLLESTTQQQERSDTNGVDQS
ncbi:MAG: SAM-dependent methyltransferase, partial [Myxococcota bacterium]